MNTNVGSSGESSETPPSCKGCPNLEEMTVPGPMEPGIVRSCLLERAYYELGNQINAPTTEWVEIALSSANEELGLNSQVVFGKRAQNANTGCPIIENIEEARSIGNPTHRVNIMPPPPLFSYHALLRALGY